jgi:hypothetical protein
MADDRVTRTRSGVELTDELIARLAERAEAGFDLAPRANPGGRPSLGGGTSPRVQFRVDAATFEALLARAAAEGRGVSEVAREALERYLREGQHAAAGSVTVPGGPDEPAVPGGVVAGRRARRS